MERKYDEQTVNKKSKLEGALRMESTFLFRKKELKYEVVDRKYERTK